MAEAPPEYELFSALNTAVKDSNFPRVIEAADKILKYFPDDQVWLLFLVLLLLLLFCRYRNLCRFVYIFLFSNQGEKEEFSLRLV